ncbi:MAG: type II toxin-antitoxin system Phd/YefM family antitoxin [Gammaproteobacteria bacterium]|nr:type II toxin-antitoxin system Phd/YefM family antitoxin [Gammaproteobacteria bacterium]
MHIVNIHEAKTQLSKLIEAAMKGEETVITKAGKPVARLCPLQVKTKIVYGLLKDKIKIHADFDGPLPEHKIKSFEA